MTKQQQGCNWIEFGLFVTGKSEQNSLPLLFKPLTNQVCSFKIKGKIEQISPISSKKRIIKMVGKGKQLPEKQVERISLPARRYLAGDNCRRLILLDDLERRDPQQVYDVYRSALDHVLKPEQKSRASVHFLVNMLEAYFFAHAEAVNIALELTEPISDHPFDVETIGHPKSKLKSITTYHEIEDSEKILKRLDLEHILSRPDTCSFLRSCVAWIVKNLAGHMNQTYIHSLNLVQKYHLHDGTINPITQNQ